MKHKLKFRRAALIVFSCLMLSVLLGCKEENIEDKNLLGSWKCIGFGNTTTDSISSVVSYHSDSYTLNFKEDNQLKGKACWSNLSIEYQVFSNNKIKINLFTRTTENDCGDGNLFTDSLGESTHYSFSENKLLLFYNKTEYLIFKPLKL